MKKLILVTMITTVCAASLGAQLLRLFTEEDGSEYFMTVGPSAIITNLSYVRNASFGTPPPDISATLFGVGGQVGFYNNRIFSAFFSMSVFTPLAGKMGGNDYRNNFEQILIIDGLFGIKWTNVFDNDSMISLGAGWHYQFISSRLRSDGSKKGYTYMPTGIGITALYSFKLNDLLLLNTGLNGSVDFLDIQYTSSAIYKLNFGFSVTPMVSFTIYL